MIVRKDIDATAEDVLMEEARGVKKRVLISEADGAPNFIMRQFTIEPGGHTPYHTHSWEHEVYVLSGTGRVRCGEKGYELGAGSVVLVLPEEEHNFVNTGSEPLVFLCIIPK
ncbi:MAG: cupin domain-containing protein [Candidatus Aegiribacteria sp.]|nr:cupin domain-containing protein [Candidatus Aegiribacteria sp.]